MAEPSRVGHKRLVVEAQRRRNAYDIVRSAGKPAAGLTRPELGVASLFELLDCFRCLPNYGNDLRRQYNQILADIAGSNLLSYVVSQICKRSIQAGKIDPTMAKDVLNTNYALS